MTKPFYDLTNCVQPISTLNGAQPNDLRMMAQAFIGQADAMLKMGYIVNADRLLLVAEDLLDEAGMIEAMPRVVYKKGA